MAPTHLNSARSFLGGMSRDNRIHVPSSQGGIVRYFDDYKSKLEVTPQAVLAACVAIALLAILARQFA